MTRSIPATFVLSALFSAALAGCGDGASAPKIETAKSPVQRVVDPQVPAADSTTLASDNASFAFDVYKQLILTNTNLVFSPASISIALAMTYAGAAGTTATEMAQTLHFTLPPEQAAPGVQCPGPDPGLARSGLPWRRWRAHAGEHRQRPLGRADLHLQVRLPRHPGRELWRRREPARLHQCAGAVASDHQHMGSRPDQQQDPGSAATRLGR